MHTGTKISTCDIEFTYLAVYTSPRRASNQQRLVPLVFLNVRSCVRREVTIVSLYSCCITRLLRTSIYRADTRRMTKSHTVDPESRFNLSTTRACCTRIFVLGEASRRLCPFHPPLYEHDEHENHSLSFVLPFSFTLGF
jgi:hypothetical protein